VQISSSFPNVTTTLQKYLGSVAPGAPALCKALLNTQLGPCSQPFMAEEVLRLGLASAADLAVSALDAFMSDWPAHSSTFHLLGCATQCAVSALTPLVSACLQTHLRAGGRAQRPLVDRLARFLLHSLQVVEMASCFAEFLPLLTASSTPHCLLLAAVIIETAHASPSSEQQELWLRAAAQTQARNDFKLAALQGAPRVIGNMSLVGPSACVVVDFVRTNVLMSLWDNKAEVRREAALFVRTILGMAAPDGPGPSPLRLLFELFQALCRHCSNVASFWSLVRDQLDGTQKLSAVEGGGRRAAFVRENYNTLFDSVHNARLLVHALQSTPTTAAHSRTASILREFDGLAALLLFR
jgi:hypothetical protein